MKVENKNIIITGGAGGIGSSLVHMLLVRRAIVGVADNDSKKLEKLNNAISDDQRKYFFPYEIDSSDFNSVKKMVEDFFEKNKTIDGLVNTAAVLKDEPLISIFRGKIKKHSLENWEITIKTNLYGYFFFHSRSDRKNGTEKDKGSYSQCKFNLLSRELRTNELCRI